MAKTKVTRLDDLGFVISIGDKGSNFFPLKDTYIVVCTHPIDGILDAMAKVGLLPQDATKRLLEEMKPHSKNDKINWDVLVDEDPVVLDGYAINFIWHGDDALSALAWMHLVPRKDLLAIMQWCESQFK